jgi:hypothetical protein
LEKDEVDVDESVFGREGGREERRNLASTATSLPTK